MADKKFNIADKVFLIILLCGLLSIFGCASQAKVRQTPQMDSVHHIAQVQPQDQGKPYQGPNVLVRGYHHDIKHDGNTKYSVENSWDVSEDGNSGSISSTTIIKHEHNIKGEYGRTIGAAGLGRYSGGF